MILTNQNSDAKSQQSGLWGWLSRWKARRQQHRMEDLLKHLHACERRRRTASVESAAGFLHVSTRRAMTLIAQAEARGLLRRAANGLALTDHGRELAMAVLRAHRLWERYLADEAGMPLPRVHATANRLEHERVGDQVDELDAVLGFPHTDPHGDPIPSAAGQLAAVPGIALTDWSTGEAGHIVHLEDEPAFVFRQIVDLKLMPGQRLQLQSVDEHGQYEVNIDGRTLLLSPQVAANVYLEPLQELHPTAIAAPRRLSELHQSEAAVIDRIDDSLRGLSRRRLLDLGMTPGTVVSAEHTAMFRDPTAYRVRGTLVALRREQADRILLRDESTGE
ncbi:MAG: FeoA domain-containing protein [Phycisphaeraceae bacterium]|nr:FeoA domain-containing protein [Phycisphaeraceae bacterium]